jgi:hypothetical protein
VRQKDEFPRRIDTNKYKEYGAFVFIGLFFSKTVIRNEGSESESPIMYQRRIKTERKHHGTDGMARQFVDKYPGNGPAA